VHLLDPLQQIQGRAGQYLFSGDRRPMPARERPSKVASGNDGKVGVGEHPRTMGSSGEPRLAGASAALPQKGIIAE